MSVELDQVASGASRRWWNEPRFLLHLNRTLKWAWIVMMPVVVLVRSLQHSITLVLLLSLYANMAANWASERALEAQLEEQSVNEQLKPRPNDGARDPNL